MNIYITIRYTVYSVWPALWQQSLWVVYSIRVNLYITARYTVHSIWAAFVATISLRSLQHKSLYYCQVHSLLYMVRLCSYNLSEYSSLHHKSLYYCQVHSICAAFVVTISLSRLQHKSLYYCQVHSIWPVFVYSYNLSE